MAVLSWNNNVDTATIAVIDGESPVSSTTTLATSKLQTRQLSDVFRQAFHANGILIIDFDLTSAKTTDLIGILGYSSNLAGKSFTLDFGTSAGATDVGTETGTLWSGGEVNARYSHFVFLTTGHSARYVRLTISGLTGGSPVTNYDIGRVWLDDSYAPSFSMDFTIGMDDPSDFTITRGGSAYASARNMPRVLKCKCFGLNNTDFTGNPGLLTMSQAVGTHAEIICLPLTDTSQNLHRLGVFGHIQSNQGLRVLSTDITDNRFVIVEDF